MADIMCIGCYKNLISTGDLCQDCKVRVSHQAVAKIRHEDGVWPVNLKFPLSPENTVTMHMPRIPNGTELAKLKELIALLVPEERTEGIK